MAAQAAELCFSPGGSIVFEANPVHLEFREALQQNLRDGSTIDLSLGREKIRRVAGGTS